MFPSERGVDARAVGIQLEIKITVFRYRDERDGDMDLAIDYYLKAADAGSPEAMCRLGEMYRKGQRLPQNDKAAIGWYRKAAAKGHLCAQKILSAPWRRPDCRRVGLDEIYRGEVD